MKIREEIRHRNRPLGPLPMRSLGRTASPFQEIVEGSMSYTVAGAFGTRAHIDCREPAAANKASHLLWCNLQSLRDLLGCEELGGSRSLTRAATVFIRPEAFGFDGFEMLLAYDHGHRSKRDRSSQPHYTGVILLDPRPILRQQPGRIEQESQLRDIRVHSHRLLHLGDQLDCIL